MRCDAEEVCVLSQPFGSLLSTKLITIPMDPHTLVIGDTFLMWNWRVQVPVEKIRGTLGYY